MDTLRLCGRRRGGSAGCVIVNRLVRSGASVCVLEAGPVDRNPFIHMPAGFVKTLFTTPA